MKNAVVKNNIPESRRVWRRLFDFMLMSGAVFHCSLVSALTLLVGVVVMNQDEKIVHSLEKNRSQLSIRFIEKTEPPENEGLKKFPSAMALDQNDSEQLHKTINEYISKIIFKI